MCLSPPARGAEDAKEKLPDDFRPTPRGTFESPRPQEAAYRFGWAAVPAAVGEVKLRREKSELQFEGKVRTTGFVRSLWQMDAQLESRLVAATLRPIVARQTEKRRSEKVETHVEFGDSWTVSRRQEIPQDKEPKVKRLKLPAPLDLFGALLMVRSQPLEKGDRYQMVVVPQRSPFLAEIEVLGRERLKVRAGEYDAIKVDLKLRKIDKKGRLEPHGKFKRGSGWLSDDGDRLLLRVESDVFVGSVWAELEKVSFGD